MSSTVHICMPIPKEDYDKALAEGPESIINEGILFGYGVHRAKVEQIDDKYYLSYDRHTSCD